MAKNQPLKKKADIGACTGDQAEKIVALRELKEKVLADKIELQTEIMRGDFIKRQTVAACFGRIMATYMQVTTLDLTVGDTITAILRVKETHLVRSAISDDAYAAMRYIKNECEAFIKQ